MLTIDTDKLLQPISAAQPAGESLRYDGIYDQVRDARKEDDPTADQGVWKTNRKKADWKYVDTLCRDALETRSKDLQLGVWLLESWLHLHGITGVRHGLTMLTNLCEAFWDDLHPAIVDEDLEYRVAPIEWMSEKLSIKLKQLPLTRPKTGDLPAYSWVDWEHARQFENLAKLDKNVLESVDVETAITREKFLVSATLTPTEVLTELASEWHGAIDQTDVLETCLTTRCGQAAPSLRVFKEALATCYRLLEDSVMERQHTGESQVEPITPEEPIEIQPIAENPQEYAGTLAGSGHIRSRADAYRRLAEAAEYLQRTEPHSPTPYLVKRAVEWGRMPLSELLQEIVRGEGDLYEIYALLGIKERGERYTNNEE